MQRIAVAVLWTAFLAGAILDDASAVQDVADDAAVAQDVADDASSGNANTKENASGETIAATPKEQERGKSDKPKSDKTVPISPKIVIVKPPTKQEPALIWGLEWWELLCIVIGSMLILMFVCVCCCAILESGQIQRQEVRGPNGERLRFLQAPGRHMVMVVDNRFSRMRTNNGANNQTVTTANNQAMATAEAPAANPPHGPTVQPLYPKV